VPEIYEKVIEIRAIAREPGERAKIAVYSSDDRIDPVGACVGIKGVRVQSIVRELNNERIDIVPFSSNPEMFVTRALAPAKVVYIDMDELEKAMTVAVEDEKLSLAIGRNGQNARLASKLTGWKVNIMSETEYNEQKRREAEMLVPVSQLEGVGAKIQERLAAVNISSVQRLAMTPPEVLVKVEGIGARTAESLTERAKQMAQQLEEEYRQREEDEKRATAKLQEEEAEESLSADDVFQEDESPEGEEQPQAVAPETEGVTGEEKETTQ
jgi:N utilization substance protein A